MYLKKLIILGLMGFSIMLIQGCDSGSSDDESDTTTKVTVESFKNYEYPFTEGRVLEYSLEIIEHTDGIPQTPQQSTGNQVLRIGTHQSVSGDVLIGNGIGEKNVLVNSAESLLEFKFDDTNDKIIWLEKPVSADSIWSYNYTNGATDISVTANIVGVVSVETEIGNLDALKVFHQEFINNQLHKSYFSHFNIKYGLIKYDLTEFDDQGGINQTVSTLLKSIKTNPEEEEEEETESNNIQLSSYVFPLNNGNTWVFNASGDQSGTSTISLESSGTSNNGDLLFNEIFTSSNDEEEDEPAQVGNNTQTPGLHDYSNGIIVKNRLLYPLEIGKKWTSNGLDFEVISTENITTEAGTFSTVKVEAKQFVNSQLIFEETIHYGTIGFVKLSFTLYDDETFEVDFSNTYSLKSHTISD